VLVDIALVEREIDRARRAWGLFFEVFSQRGSAFAPVLAAHDVIAADCYTAARTAVPGVLRGPQLKPLTYMQHSASPATWRGGIHLSRLLGEANPFPLIRIPWDRDNPWQGVFLHEDRRPRDTQQPEPAGGPEGLGEQLKRLHVGFERW
jgi:hypothetical protein